MCYLDAKTLLVCGWHAECPVLFCPLLCKCPVLCVCACSYHIALFKYKMENKLQSVTLADSMLRRHNDSG